MMRPDGLKTRIFLDGGDPEETRDLVESMGFLDGQTTNPTLISRNPAVTRRLERGDYFSKDEILENYRSIVLKISRLIPEGSISIEVNADKKTKAEEMLSQARKMFSWIPNAHIKFPTVFEGLKAAEKATKEGMRVNMTLCFTQEQAAAVHSATRGAKKGSVFVSPFVGRLDDIGFNGMGLIENIRKMFLKGKSHVELLVASVRTMDHFNYALYLGTDIVTCPYKILKQWAGEGMPMPERDYRYDVKSLRAIPYREMDMEGPWQELRFQHELIDKGLAAFAKDWNRLTGEGGG